MTTSTGTSLEEEDEEAAPWRRLLALALNGKTPAIGRISEGCGGACKSCCCCSCWRLEEEALLVEELILGINSKDWAT